MKNLKICFEEDAVLQRIESLIINNCSNLVTIVPSSVSLAHLTILEVVGCRSWEFEYVMSASTAKSLGQLKTMKVIDCDYLGEIVSEETQKGKEVPIIFKQLTTLELVTLKKLNSFCGSKNCAFKFPSLENFIVSACPQMKVFSQHKVHSAPNLQKIYYVHDKDKKRWCWQDNINSTIVYLYHNKKFYEGMHELNVFNPRDDDPLISIWLSKEAPRKDWFSGLKSLKLFSCDALHKRYAVVPSNVLCCLKSLQELHVGRCKTIEWIFEMDDSKSRGSSFQLKNLTLEWLSNLKSVWQRDKPEILLGFQNLQQVSIYDCNKLTSVFPAALARDLKKLQDLEIRNCHGLKDIVGKEEGAVEGLDKYVFPHLTTLKLSELPQLTDFNSGNFTLECPELKHLELFPNQKQKYPEGISKGKSLRLNPNHSLALQFMNQSGFHQYLNELYLDSHDGQNLFHFEFKENLSLPLGEILVDDKTPPNLEIIEIWNNKHCKTINILEEAGKRMHDLKELKLYSLSELDSISGLQHLLKLQLLRLYDCEKLTTLGQIPCSNLKELYIKYCDGFQCLFTSSAAKMLIHLEELKVKRCDSLKEIVGKEEESGTEEDIIEFKRLERITLKDLDSLGCFYSGNAKLKFPSLIRLDIEDCPEMKIFSQRAIHVETPFQVFYTDDYGLLLDDLNVATGCYSLLQEERLVLGDHPVLKDLWLGNIPLSQGFYSSFELRYLVVEGCEEFLSSAILLPSHLLQFLVNLEVLEVRRCKSVEAIFEVKDTPTNNVVIPLKEMILEDLPTLKHVWSKDPEGSISLSCLEEVVVNGCQSITSLFPESFVKGNLKRLEVRSCGELVEIVTKDEASATYETNKEFFMFPKLTSLTLHYLPNLTYICGGGLQIINWPDLQELEIYGANSIHSSVKVVAPRLKRLSVDKEGVILLEKEVLHLDYQNINCLKLQGFNDIDSDAFPLDVSSKVQLMSNVEEFVVSNSAFKEIFPSKKPEIIPSKLIGLELTNLHKLESIGLEHSWMESLVENIRSLTVLNCHGLTNMVPSTTVLSFSSLTWLKVEDCPTLKYLFSSSTAKSLDNLQELYISSCEELENVVAYQPHDGVITFEGLKKLSLSKLPKFETFYTPNSTLNFPSLVKFMVSECNRLEYLFSFSTAKSLQFLKKMEVSKCESLETIIVATQEADAPHEDLTLPKVNKLSLSKLPKLESFYTRNSTLNFPYLEKVMVSECNRLEYLFSFSTAKSLQFLEKMDVSKCESLESVVVVATQEADVPHEDLTFGIYNLSLSELPKLESFFNGKSTLKLDFYEVSISQCKSMKTFSHGALEVTNLKKVKIDGVLCSTENLNAAVSQQFENRMKQH